MLTIFGFVLGVAGGAAGTAAWLLTEPDAGSERPWYGGDSPSIPGRVNALQTRFQEAVAAGKLAGAERQTQVRNELETYRGHPERAATPS
ncbi:MAG: hypothetical protein ACRDFX_03660 [Chloroflexota bacterium]